MSKSAERAGKPNVAELVRQGRLKYNATRGLDPNPNPEVGPVLDPVSGMRSGLTPEKYHRLVLESEKKRKLGKNWDFLPELSDAEIEIYVKWLKAGGPKKMRATGREAALAQSLNALELIKQYDPDAAKALDSIPASKVAQEREAIGSVQSTPEEPEEEADVAPEARVVPPSPEEAPGYEAIDADAEDTAPEVVEPKKKPGPKPKLK